MEAPPTLTVKQIGNTQNFALIEARNEDSLDRGPALNFFLGLENRTFCAVLTGGPFVP